LFQTHLDNHFPSGKRLALIDSTLFRPPGYWTQARFSAILFCAFTLIAYTAKNRSSKSSKVKCCVIELDSYLFTPDHSANCRLSRALTIAGTVLHHFLYFHLCFRDRGNLSKIHAYIVPTLHDAGLPSEERIMALLHYLCANIRPFSYFQREFF